MSPLSSVEWDIRICHALVSVRCREAGLTRRGWRRSESTAACPYAPDGGGLAWKPVLVALEQALQQGRGRGGTAHVVLADSMVRYAVVPWDAAVTRADEEAAFLRHRFGLLYDNETADWDLRIERPHGEHARLASAVDPALIGALDALLGARGIRLRSLVPALADTVNRRLASLSAPAAWLVLHDAGSLTMARWEDQAWLSARCLRAGAGWRMALAGLIEREEYMHDGKAEASTVYLEDGERGAPPPLPGWRVVDLSMTAAKEGA